MPIDYRSELRRPITLGTVEESIVARSQELAEVGRRLEEARQSEAKAREDLARVAQDPRR